ncbi:hypothetical protein [Agrobacterium tumefaciens]|uniref:hypothetical protein n=1 Tax=Agrobacterium tumefaciens TaxID=358 RepID=UPI0015734C0A|nr:hypothetical protein [Agrobacterium tumefaciens]
MKIECILQRKDGTTVTLDDTTYRFKPAGDDPRHIADVSIQSHIRRFLGIPEGYQSAEPVAAAVKVPDDKPVGSLVHSASYTLADKSVITLEELVSRAFKESGMTIREWNELSDEDRYEQIDTTLGEIEQKAEEDAEPGHFGEVGGRPSEPPAETTVTEQPTIAPQVEPEQDDESEADDSGDQEEPPVTEQSSDSATDELDREKLAAEFEVRFGRKPNGRLSAVRIKQLLDEDAD